MKMIVVLTIALVCVCVVRVSVANMFLVCVSQPSSMEVVFTLCSAARWLVCSFSHVELQLFEIFIKGQIAALDFSCIRMESFIYL